METRQNITVVTTKGDFTFTFTMPVGCSWGNAVDAAYDILTHVGDMAKQSILSSNPVQENASAVEPTYVEGNEYGNQ